MKLEPNITTKTPMQKTMTQYVWPLKSNYSFHILVCATFMMMFMVCGSQQLVIVLSIRKVFQCPALWARSNRQLWLNVIFHIFCYYVFGFQMAFRTWVLSYSCRVFPFILRNSILENFMRPKNRKTVKFI